MIALRKANSPLMPDSATIERFLAHCHRRRYPSRTDVFRPGDPANTIYYLISGSVSIITEEEDGRELVLGYLGPGEFVGELGLFVESEHREVVLRTRTACELAEIGHERFYDLLLTRLPPTHPSCCTRSARRSRSACSIPAARPAAWPSSTSPTASSAPCTTWPGNPRP